MCWHNIWARETATLRYPHYLPLVRWSHSVSNQTLRLALCWMSRTLLFQFRIHAGPVRKDFGTYTTLDSGQSFLRLRLLQVSGLLVILIYEVRYRWRWTIIGAVRVRTRLDVLCYAAVPRPATNDIRYSGCCESSCNYLSRLWIAAKLSAGWPLQFVAHRPRSNPNHR